MQNTVEAPSAAPSSQVDSQPLTTKATIAGNAFSKLLTAAAPVVATGGSETSFAAFKVLPIDPARSQRQTGSFVEPADEFTGAKSCKEAVDLMVDAIASACEDAGSGGREGFILKDDVVRSVIGYLCSDHIPKFHPLAWPKLKGTRVCTPRWR